MQTECIYIDISKQLKDIIWELNIHEKYVQPNFSPFSSSVLKGERNEMCREKEKVGYDNLVFDKGPTNIAFNCTSLTAFWMMSSGGNNL